MKVKPFAPWFGDVAVCLYLMKGCPDISEITIERTLKHLLDEGYIQKIGGGRGAAYAKR